LLAALAVALPRVAQAEALLLVEADTGKVLQAENATYPWYPASVTKLMTAYVTLKAVKEGRITLDTLFTVSPIAASQSPSKMGFRPGIQLTVDNALKMMLVNQNAQRLGMTQTSYVNPNGLPADGQITSARDLAILARAIIRDLPEYEYFVHIPAIRYGRRVTQNFNKLIGRYPGADGFKTGFICASGYNLVASATRDGKRLIAVVLGASSGKARAVKAAQLLERGFANNSLSWLRPSLGTVENLTPVDASPPNLRDEMCGGKRHKPASDEDEDTIAGATPGNSEPALAFFTAPQLTPTLKPSEMLAAAPAPSEPVPVYTGPTRTGAALIAAVAADAEEQTRHRDKKSKVTLKKPDASAEAKGDVKSESKEAKEAKPGPNKPAKHAAAKPDAAAKGSEKASQKGAGKGSDNADAKPARPKPVAKPAAKPAPKSTTGGAGASD
jgi:D-alanyl-D-alanine carboxypeptidase